MTGPTGCTGCTGPIGGGTTGVTGPTGPALLPAAAWATAMLEEEKTAGSTDPIPILWTLSGSSGFEEPSSSTGTFKLEKAGVYHVLAQLSFQKGAMSEEDINIMVQRTTPNGLAPVVTNLVTMARVSQQASLVNASYVEIFTTTADAATMALVWQSSLAGPDSVVLKNAVLTISSMFT